MTHLTPFDESRPTRHIPACENSRVGWGELANPSNFTKLISNKSLREFVGIHSDADEPLRVFRQKVEKGAFDNFAGLRAAFAGVDRVGEHDVFNIGGNKYRLIAGIHFAAQRLFVKTILTHAEYDKGAWK